MEPITEKIEIQGTQLELVAHELRPCFYEVHIVHPSGGWVAFDVVEHQGWRLGAITSDGGYPHEVHRFIVGLVDRTHAAWLALPAFEPVSFAHELQAALKPAEVAA